MYFQYVKFIVVGTMNTLISFFIFFVCLTMLQCNYLITLVISYVIGVLNSYFCNSTWTFEKNYTCGKQFVKFILVYILTFIINFFLVFLLVDAIKISVLVSQGISLFVVSIVSFMAHKYWSFKIEETKRDEVYID